jgi:arginyl-tRNA--protein-N-Asp/Glu arginylyltransferase
VRGESRECAGKRTAKRERTRLRLPSTWATQTQQILHMATENANALHGNISSVVCSYLAPSAPAMPSFRLTEPLLPATMDALLAQGWYRSGQAVFTTNWLILDEGLIISRVLWARVDVQGWTPTRRHRRLLKENACFSLTLSDAVITEEIETLFASYLEHTGLDSGPTVSAVLLGHYDDGAPHVVGQNFFHTRMFTMRDGEKLIAVGYFDEGRETSAGILNFYHPDYRKYSLSILLYFEEIRHAAETGKRWFYPGYIATDYPKFDYKLLAGIERTEVLDVETGNWIPYSSQMTSGRV